MTEKKYSKSLEFDNKERGGVVLVDGDLVRRNSFRQQLDVLGCASLAFESLQDFMAAQCNPCEVRFMIIVLQGNHIFPQAQSMLEQYDFPILLVVASDDFSALSFSEKSLLNNKKVDVIPESCSNYELNWRIQFLKNRTISSSVGSEFFNFGIFIFDVKRRQAWIGKEKVFLKPLEFELSLELFKNINSLLSREKLYAQIWGEEIGSVKSRKLDVCISSVRKKMGLHEGNGFLLRSVYGRGYELRSLDL